MTTTGTILKAAAPLPRRRVEAAVHAADVTVRETVAAAREEAARIRAGAAAELERTRAEARRAGEAEGLARAAATLAAAALERDRRLAAADRELALLALEVARRVLGRELALHPGVVLDVAAQAVAAARERREIAVRVNPADAAMIRAGEGRLRALLERAPGLAIREDAAVERGGVVVATEAGTIDASFTAQLAAFERALEDVAP